MNSDETTQGDFVFQLEREKEEYQARKKSELLWGNRI